MLGKMVTGVIEAAFNDGYLVNVKVADSDSFLRGVVFLPGQVTPVTAENDVAPHIQMIKRKEFPIPMPMPNPRTNEVHVSLPTLQSIEPQIPAPFPGVHILPTEVHSGVSVPSGISEAEHVNQSNSLKPEMDRDKTVEQNDKLHELDASTQVEESSADPRPASETMNLFPTIENTNSELRNEQQVFPSVNHLNEFVHNEPNSSNIELNLVPVSAEPESMPSEQHNNKSVEVFMENQTLPETDLEKDATKTKPVSIDTMSNVDNISNSNGNTSTGIANIIDMVPNHAVETIQHESVQFEQIGQNHPSDIKLSPEGCNFMEKEKSDPQNCSSLGDVNKVDFDHPIAESLVDAVPSENQIGAGT
ncbi:mitochondrial distribution and morphology protein 34-like [Vicia villosa]|uniref:mitochondrial distribution and morphology protein 34-like n=1 Tax=Vicia villosa TaxID=3911 RepID=UPI00273BB0BB|nr:mitochondrial distribution and morphology protein 34-like [Vicia villosa]